MKIDFTYIINLNSTNQVIINRLKKIDWPYNINYYVLPAVNGWEIVKDKSKSPFKFKLADWWKLDDHTNTFYNRNITPGEAGCMLSHYKCIKAAYDAGFETILILEEDFVYKGKFPTQSELDDVPDDWSMLYLDRNALWENELKVNKHVTKVGYTYNTHAYLVSRKGMEEIINSPILDNIIASDEFFSAINGASSRFDAVGKFYNANFKAYALNGGYFSQSSSTKTTSTTEFDPKILNKMKQTEESTQYLTFPLLSTPNLLDDSNWDAWCNKYIHPMVRKGEYDLLVDEPLVNCYEFPFFTKEFCDEAIVLAETKEWTKDRHEFYPTTDNLLEVLGLGEIYTRLLNEFVRPLAIWAYGLEGRSWDVLTDESFIIRYKADEQSHLSLHHDYSNLTTLVNLNPGEFEGGGTYFPKYKVLSNPKQIGTMTLHPGNITHKHGARPVLSGTRYVIVSFLKSSSHK
jgi:GR25 family glycosyltransferase involved in LPS biosynthesis